MMIALLLMPSGGLVAALVFDASERKKVNHMIELLLQRDGCAAQRVNKKNTAFLVITGLWLIGVVVGLYISLGIR